MNKSDKKLIAEAYNLVSESIRGTDIGHKIIETFKSLGWKTRFFNDGTGIAARGGEEDEAEYDIYFYGFKDSVYFYANATMPWEGGIQENDIHIPLDPENNESELKLPFTDIAKTEEVVKQLAELVLRTRLPEGPSESDIQRFNAEEKEASRRLNNDEEYNRQRDA